MRYTVTDINNMRITGRYLVEMGIISKFALKDIILNLESSINEEIEELKECYLSKKEIAKVLGVHPLTVHRLIKSGKLEAVHIGSAVRIKQSSFDSFLESSK
jgi:excisionase family DNA binding protein